MTELRPCPFCGGEARFFIDDHENGDTSHIHTIMCTNAFGCGTRMSKAISYYQPDYEEDKNELFDRWNNRISKSTNNHGEWIVDGNKYECPFCNYTKRLIGVEIPNFCSKCGSDMRGDKND